MNPLDQQLLFDHLYFVRDRILAAAAAAEADGVPLSDTAAPTIRDLRATLVHELDVQWSWRVRLRRADRTDFSPDDQELNPASFPDLAAIRDRWRSDEAEMRAWLAELDEAELNAPCRAEREGGGHPFWFHLQHIYTHGLQQFSDAAVLLTRAGHSPGELDFLDFVEHRET